MRETPDGDDTTPPEPTCVTDIAYTWTNVAVTDFASVTETVHGDDDPLHAPVHPENRHPEAAVAVSDTELPLSYVPDVVPGLAVEIPKSPVATEPEPTCVNDTVQVRMNVAVTDLAADIVT